MPIDCAVIGGGIVGLAIADAWLAREPRSKVVVFDKEPNLAAHASGRNSGVLHAGFYYAPDSLKARLTRRGNQLLHEFCAERGIEVRNVGKVVVAQREADLPRLHELLQRGAANGVPLELIDEDGLAELEPRARTFGQALWSPTTSVADPKSVVRGLATRVIERGGDVRLGSCVTGAGPGWVEVSGQRLATGHLINASGLYADRVASWFGVGSRYAMLPFKGLYWYGTHDPGWLRRHVYPVPDPRNPFLGVHLTVTVDGRAKIGPTAIPALRREDYGRIFGRSPEAAREFVEIVRLYPSFLMSPNHDVPGLLRAELPKYSRRQLVKQAASLVPSVNPRDFTVRGAPGVRAQLWDRQERRLEMDFIVVPAASSTHVLNAVSPAWTSALAVGAHVVEGIWSGGAAGAAQVS